MNTRPHLPLLLSLVFFGCGQEASVTDDSPPTCEVDDRDEPYFSGISKTGSANYVIKLVDSNPAPPAKGNNVWFIEVTNPDATAASGLVVDLEGFMPDHGHGTPVVPTVVDNGEGGYTLDPVNLFMPGYWEVSLTLSDPGDSEGSDDDVELDSVTFRFCVSG